MKGPLLPLLLAAALAIPAPVPAAPSRPPPSPPAEGEGRPWFADVTEGSGIPSLKTGEGVNGRDLDGDGLPELFLPVVRGEDRLFRNLGSLRFRDVTGDRGIAESNGIGALFGDFDGDGRDDLLVVRGAYPYGNNVLYRRGEDGRFREAPPGSLPGGRKNGIAAASADLDGDGRRDLVLANWERSDVLRNDGAPGTIRFREAPQGGGVDPSLWAWGALLADVTGDGLPDLLLAHGKGGKGGGVRLYANLGGGRLEDRTEAAGLSGGGWSMSVVAADFDGDGDPDLFVNGFDGPDRLYRNDGEGRFTDVTVPSGISGGRSVGAAAADLDGDLLPDLAVAGFEGPVRVFRNLGGMRFAAVPPEASGVGPWKRNEGILLADLDGDGGPEMYVANYDGHNRLYRNERATGRFLAVLPAPGERLPEGSRALLYGSGEGAPLLASLLHLGGFGFCTQGPDEMRFHLPREGRFDLAVEIPGAAGAAARRFLFPGASGKVVLPEGACRPGEGGKR